MIMKRHHKSANIPPYLAKLDKKLSRFIVDIPTETLFTHEGRIIAEGLTHELSSSLTLLNALTQLPADEYNILAKHQERAVINTTILLEPSLFYLRSQVENGSQRARQELRKLHRFVEERLKGIATDLLDGLVRAAKEAECPLTDNIIKAHHDCLRAKMADQGKEVLNNPTAIPSPDEVVKELIAQAPKGATCYDLYDMFNDSVGGNMPPEALEPMVFCFLSSSQEIGQAIGLSFLLHINQKTRQACTKAFIHCYPELSLSPLNQSRLHQILLWLSDTERLTLVKALKYDLSQPPKKITLPATLYESHALFCDGAGCYGSLMLLKTKQGYQSAHVLTKEKYGIKDAFLAPPMSKKETQQRVDYAVESMSGHGLTAARVEQTALTLQWKHFIAIAHQQGRVPLIGLLGIVELIDDEYWQPKLLLISVIQSQLSPYKLKDKKKALEASGQWLGGECVIGIDCWFESTAKLHQLTTRAKRERWSQQKTIEAVIKDVLSPNHIDWQVRFALCAVILFYSDNNALYEGSLGQFEVLIESAEKESTFSKIPLIHEVAKLSIAASEEQSKHEGHPLEII